MHDTRTPDQQWIRLVRLIRVDRIDNLSKDAVCAYDVANRTKVVEEYKDFFCGVLRRLRIGDA